MRAPPGSGHDAEERLRLAILADHDPAGRSLVVVPPLDGPSVDLLLEEAAITLRDGVQKPQERLGPIPVDAAQPGQLLRSFSHLTMLGTARCAASRPAASPI